MVEVCSPKRYVDVLTSGAHERDLVWKWGPCSYSQVKMKSYWDRVGPKCHDWDSLSRERFGERQMEESHVKKWVEIGMMQIQAKGS